MKVLLGITVLLLSANMMVEGKNRVYGPKAKNEQTWISKSSKSELVTYSNERITGGVAKNNQVWTKKMNGTGAVCVSSREDFVVPKGPAAKNNTLHNKRRK